MERYLGEAIKEYERSRDPGTGDPPSLIFKPLINIKQMLDHADQDNPFTKKFIEEYKTAISLVRNELLDVPIINSGY